MNILIYILSGIIAGIIIGLIIKNRQAIASQGCCVPENQGIMNERIEEKQKNMAKLKEFINQKTDRITNDEVQALLKISDATVARYFNELEKEGVVKQVGDVGQGVYYNIVK